jgi:hypothetical protein
MAISDDIYTGPEYDPSTYEKYKGEAGGAVAGATSAASIAMPTMNPFIIGGAAVIGGIAGWLSSMDNEQQEDMFKLKQMQEQAIAKQQRIAAGTEATGALKNLSYQAAKNRQRTRMMINRRNDLTQEQKDDMAANISARQAANAAQAAASQQTRDMQIARGDIAKYVAGEKEAIQKDMDKRYEAKMRTFEAGLTSLVGLEGDEKDDDPEKLTEAEAMKKIHKKLGTSSGGGAGVFTGESVGDYLKVMETGPMQSLYGATG